MCDKVDGYHKSGASDGDYQRLVAAYSASPSIAELAARPDAVVEGDLSSSKVSYTTAVPASMLELFWVNLQRSWINQTRYLPTPIRKRLFYTRLTVISRRHCASTGTSWGSSVCASAKTC